MAIRIKQGVVNMNLKQNKRSNSYAIDVAGGMVLMLLMLLVAMGAMRIVGKFIRDEGK